MGVLGNYGQVARDTADRLGGLNLNTNTPYRNDQHDAFRHAYTSALFAQKFGADIAKRLGDMNEGAYDPNGDITEQQHNSENNMDKWNNDVGRKEYQKWKDAKDAGTTTDPLDKWIYDRVKDGTTINDPIDHRSWVEPVTDGNGGISGDPFTGMPWPNAIDPNTNIDFIKARNIVIRRNPLVMDLDGDGLELIGASGTVLFDHNADGIKTGTGWARPDDGFLVRDLDGNGLIDTGRELFGVDTIKSNGGLATDGFDALRDLDTNNDGQITSADTAFSELKVWRDLNQDGISQTNELQSLSNLNITSINTNGTSTGPQAGQIINNNQIALSSTFTQNGQTKTVGAIDLEANNFFTQFPTEVVDNTGTPIAITTQAQGLPQMNGAGMVRDMRAAASIDGDFAAALTSFAAGTVKEVGRADVICKFKSRCKPRLRCAITFYQTKKQGV